MLLFAQLPERNGAGGGNVEGIDPVGHGDAHRVIAGGDGGVGKAIALGAQHDGQLRLGGQGGIVPLLPTTVSVLQRMVQRLRSRRLGRPESSSPAASRTTGLRWTG